MTKVLNDRRVILAGLQLVLVIAMKRLKYLHSAWFLDSRTSILVTIQLLFIIDGEIFLT